MTGQSSAAESNAPSPSLPFPLQSGERVLLVCRKHWVYLWPRTIAMLLATLLPPLIVQVLLSKAGAYEGTVVSAFWLLTLIYIGYWGVRMFLTVYTYQHDVWVITNQRIVDAIKRNPLNLRVSSADLVNVQDMTVERNGIFQTLLDYGDVICQTAADVQEFRISAIPHPRETQALVDRERDRERLRANAG